jgi:hypothetical protein
MSKQQELPGAWTDQRILEVLTVRNARKPNKLTCIVLERILDRAAASIADTLNQ